MKRILTYVLAFAAALFAAFAAAACTPNTPQTPTYTEVSELGGEKLTDKNYVRTIGRYEYENGAAHFYYTASGFSVRFTGTRLEVTFVATNTASDKNRPYFVAEIDGAESVFALTEPTQTAVIAENLAQGTHTVTVLKRSEPENSATTVTKISTDGEFIRPSAHTGLKFQILGGSGISGHGCLGSPNEGWTTQNSSPLSAFGYLAARAFGAETQFVSNSGMGLKWGYRGVADLISAYEAAGLVAEYKADGSTKAVRAKGEWDHASWVPDLVIVNIGGNDWNSHISGLSGAARTAAENEFRQAVKTLLTRINGLYSGAKVVWTCNSTRSGNGALAREAVAELEFKDSVLFVEIDDAKDGADNHAGVETQKKNARTVADAISSVFGLEQINLI